MGTLTPAVSVRSVCPAWQGTGPRVSTRPLESRAASGRRGRNNCGAACQSGAHNHNQGEQTCPAGQFVNRGGKTMQAIGHSATRIRGRRILVVGGENANNRVRDPEVFHLALTSPRPPDWSRRARTTR